jgi:hypothetical protein
MSNDTLLIFNGSVRKYSEFEDLAVVSNWSRKWHSVRISPHNVTVYETADCNKAYRFVAEVGRALKRGLASDAEWIDCSRLPESVEIGMVVLRGDEE